MNGNMIIKNAAELVTCSGFAAKKGAEMSELQIIPDGAVVVKEGKIEAVGNTGDVMAELEKSKFGSIRLRYHRCARQGGIARLCRFAHPFCFRRLPGRRIFMAAARRQLHGDHAARRRHRQHGSGNPDAAAEELIAIRHETAGFDVFRSALPPWKAKAATGWIVKRKSNNWKSWPILTASITWTSSRRFWAPMPCRKNIRARKMHLSIL